MNSLKENNDILYSIKQINFGILSADEIRKISVGNLDNPKLNGKGSIYDPIMGSANDNSNCVSCGLNSKECPGHLSHIELSENLLHPLYLKYIVSFLRCICFVCKKLAVSKEQLILNGLLNIKGHKRFIKIEKFCSEGYCYHCQNYQPKISLVCVSNMESYSIKVELKKQKKSAFYSPSDILRIFENISNEDVEILGLDSNLIHPKNMILQVLPVLPTSTRPCIHSDGVTCDDDLTNQYIQIIKINNRIRDLSNNEKDNIKKQKEIQNLCFKISTMYNNSKSKCKQINNQKKIQGVKERISGKDGLIRNNLIGKRVDFSGRTVIGAGSNNKLDELTIPQKFADTLTLPEIVNSKNKEYLSNLISQSKVVNVIRDNKKINMYYATNNFGTRLFYGDIVLRNGNKKEIKITSKNFQLKKGDKLIREGKEIPLIIPHKKNFILKEGDVVERCLKEGDLVLLNRQPTLHSGSMMAFKIRIDKFNTMRYNLAVCKSFNSDFDGDEMNIHVPQDLLSRAEMENISHVSNFMISPQTSRPNLCIVQDALLGAYKMTKENDILPREDFINIAYSANENLFSIEKLEMIEKVFKRFGKNNLTTSIYNGKALFSLILPDNLIYQKRNNADPIEHTVKIYNGVLYEGVVDKSILGQSLNSLIQIINKEYGAARASEFIDDINFLANHWLAYNGFSIGLKDCVIEDNFSNEKSSSKSSTKQISDVIAKCYLEADYISDTITNNIIKEIRLTGVLNKAKDVGMKLAKESMDKDNNLLSTIYSGSKGDFFNVSQITGLLGQQNIDDKRIKPTLNGGTRSLPHYGFSDLTSEEKYESQGFIKNSFIHGLNPREFFFHSMTGRIGIISTSMNTARTGYTQRKLVKICEDLQTMYDGTVRDMDGKIYQLAYGDNYFDPKEVINMNECCDVSRIVNLLNSEVENNLEEDSFILEKDSFILEKDSFILEEDSFILEEDNFSLEEN